MRKRLYMAAFLLVPLLLGAGVLLEHSHVTMGKQVAFTGLDLKNAPTALPGAGATKCVNYVFDKNASLHVRKGLDQWNSITHAGGLRFLSSYTDVGGTGWYMVATDDTLWIAPDYATSWDGYEFVGDAAVNNGTVDVYDAEHFVHGDGLYDWRTILDDGAGLYITIAGTAYLIDAIYSDSLIRLESAVSGNASDQSYGIEQQYASIQDMSVCNKKAYLATDNGIYEWDGVDFTLLTSDTVGYYRYDIDSVQYYGTSSQPNRRGELKIYLGTWRGTGTEPAFMDGTPEGLWVIGKEMYLSTSWTCHDSTSHHSLMAGHTITNTWHNIGQAGNSGGLKWIIAYGSLVMPSRVSTYDAIFVDTEIDPDYTVTFTADTIVVDSIAQPEAYYNGYVAYSKVTPADSSWDSTRFASGNWLLKISNQLPLPIIGNVDSSGSFFIAGGAIKDTTVLPKPLYGDMDDVTCTAYRYRRSLTSSEAYSYLTSAVYKDRLFLVREDYPDFLRYSPAFYPDSVDAYQVIGLDITNGDRIERMAVLYDNLYIFTRNTIHQLSGDPSSPSATLGRLFDGVGISAPKTFVVFEGRMLLCHQTGFYLFDGSRPQLISAAILPIIADSINWTAAGDVMCAGYYDRHLWVSYPSGASSSNNRTLVYNVDDGRWGNVSFVAGAYHKITNPSDTNKFLVGDADTGAVYVYKGHDDDGTAIQATYETGWSDFGSEVEKQIQGFHVVFDKSAACSLSINLYRNDTIVATTIIDTLTYSQSFLDKHKNVYDLDAIGRLFKVGIDMNSSAGEGWVSELTLEVVEAGEKRYDR